MTKEEALNKLITESFKKYDCMGALLELCNLMERLAKEEPEEKYEYTIPFWDVLKNLWTTKDEEKELRYSCKYLDERNVYLCCDPDRGIVTRSSDEAITIAKDMTFFVSTMWRELEPGERNGLRKEETPEEIKLDLHGFSL